MSLPGFMMPSGSSALLIPRRAVSRAGRGKGGKGWAWVQVVSPGAHGGHSVQIVVSEHGRADLRGLSPVRRARSIIERCAAPEYRDMLAEYLDHAIRVSPGGNMPHDLSRVFDFHQRYIETGSMLPE